LKGDFLRALQDPHAGFGRDQGESPSDGIRRNRVIVQVEAKIDGFARAEGENEIDLERV